MRIPASCTGIVGLKPTLGRVPHPQSPDLFGTLSHIGPMTRTVADAALMLEVMAGPDHRDPHSYGRPLTSYQAAVSERVTESLRGKKIAWSLTLGNSEVDREVRTLVESAVQVFCELGCQVEENRPAFELPEREYLVLFHSGFAARLEPYLDRFREKIDPSLLDAIEKGRQYRAVDVHKALYFRSQLFQSVQQFFQEYDLFLTPTLAAPALPVTQSTLDPVMINGKVVGSVRSSWYPYTHPFNMAGNPAISIPCGWTQEGLPVGLQVVGPWLAEGEVLQAAAAFELARPWVEKRPPL
ncbi:MAG: hypothetical protein D6736_19070 [Nitrospinota bacterium]|nr:MAG: hypothetical protein D6736_19070 [Nitrospinota bacterium]